MQVSTPNRDLWRPGASCTYDRRMGGLLGWSCAALILVAGCSPSPSSPNGGPGSTITTTSTHESSPTEDETPSLDRLAGTGVPEEADLLLSLGSQDLTDPEGSIEQLGAMPLEVDVVVLNGGAVTAGARWDGLPVLSFPEFVDSDVPPLAVVRVSPAEPHYLVPDRSDFSFGVMFRKDPVSDGSPVDNGDNLIQRADFSHPAQYKIQVDRGQPTCLVRGTGGQVFVRSGMSVDPELWYLVTCDRVGESLRITVLERQSDGTTRSVEATADGQIGSVSWPDGAPALTIGGKLTRKGEVAGTDSDQFNGLIDLPFVTVAR